MFKKLFKVPYWYLIAIPMLCIGLGTLSNQVVLWANFDKFPVMYNDEKIFISCQAADDKDAELKAIIKALHGDEIRKTNNWHLKLSAPAANVNACSNGGVFLDDIHVIMTKDSKLKAMADIWDFHDVTYSIGDLMLILGDWFMGWAPLAWLVLIIRKLIEG